MSYELFTKWDIQVNNENDDTRTFLEGIKFILSNFHNKKRFGIGGGPQWEISATVDGKTQFSNSKTFESEQAKVIFPEEIFTLIGTLPACKTAELTFSADGFFADSEDACQEIASALSENHNQNTYGLGMITPLLNDKLFGLVQFKCIENLPEFAKMDGYIFNVIDGKPFQGAPVETTDSTLIHSVDKWYIPAFLVEAISLRNANVEDRISQCVDKFAALDDSIEFDEVDNLSAEYYGVQTRYGVVATFEKLQALLSVVNELYETVSLINDKGCEVSVEILGRARNNGYAILNVKPSDNKFVAHYYIFH